MENESQQKIQELESKNQELTKKLEELSNTFKEIKTTLELHTHTGRDGSTKFFNSDIELKSGTGISVGKYGFIDYVTDSTLIGAMVVGDLVGQTGTTDNAKNTTQLSIDHQFSTNGSTNQTFFYGYRSPVYSGETNGSITSGGTTMSQTRYSWEANELDGAYVAVYDGANAGQFDFYEIASNTATTLTITGGTWTFTDTAATWVVIVPVYLGAAQYPWRRVYTMDGIGGGIRFGGGDSPVYNSGTGTWSSGQNALLYTDGTDLKFRKKDGTVTTVTVS